MKDRKKEDEDEASINSEIMISEEKSVYDKIKSYPDMGSNIVVNATFSRKNSNETENVSIKDNQSLISNQVYSNNRLLYAGNKLHVKTKSNSIHSIDTVSNNSHTNSVTNSISNYLHSTSPNSHILLNEREQLRLNNHQLKNNLSNSTKFFSPQKKDTKIALIPPAQTMKLAQTYNKYSTKSPDPYFNDDSSQQELKKVTMLIRLKEKEVKDMIKNYESMKSKFAQSKKNMIEKRDYHQHLKKNNFNLKKLICGIIKYKHDK